MAVGALFVALALFWLSTRQWPVLVRAVIWLGGAVLLVAASVLVSDQRFSLAGALGDAFTSPDWRQSALARALLLNAEVVAPFIQQLFDFFLVASVLMGALALLAFTKGERLERFLRPSIIALVAFIAGSAATLSVVAIGFGGYVRPRAYFGEGSQIQVTDGDTLRLREYALRLWGADAPEEGQVCAGLDQANCDETARDFLQSLVQRGPVHCEQRLSPQSRHPRDTFGRALVQCWVTPVGAPRIDLAEALIRAGFAVQLEGGDYGYGAAEAFARTTRAGLMGGCTLRPDIWRSRSPENREARLVFERDQTVAVNVATMGDCTGRMRP